MDFSKIRNYLFLGLLLTVTVTFLLLLKPFAYPIFWAAVVAALFYPLYQRLNSSLKHANLSATITLAAVAVIILLPLTIIGLLLIKESLALYAAFSTNSSELNQTVQNLANTIKHNPYTAQLAVDESFWIEKFSEAGRTITSYIFAALKNLTQDSFWFLVMFVIMLYTLFFFIRDGEKILKKLMYLCPLGDRYEVMLYKKFTTAASGIIKGTLLIGGIQGALGGIAFWIAGIEGALIWSILMMLFSVVPGAGSSIIWLPGAIILLITGHLAAGIFLLLVGALLISTIDNFLRPILVGKGLNMHPLLILFSTLGGIAVFGFSGFMLGPIIAALFLAFWEMYEEYYRTELAKN